ncbi:hypothetical protein BC829DRAFT_471146 [Chytridium lagenaria]|nr:hypothetical protein BC829DRAFT_471146 [Chytridium lagenaria]
MPTRGNRIEENSPPPLTAKETKIKKEKRNKRKKTRKEWAAVTGNHHRTRNKEEKFTKKTENQGQNPDPSSDGHDPTTKTKTKMKTRSLKKNPNPTPNHPRTIETSYAVWNLGDGEMKPRAASPASSSSSLSPTPANNQSSGFQAKDAPHKKTNLQKTSPAVYQGSWDGTIIPQIRDSLSQGGPIHDRHQNPIPGRSGGKKRRKYYSSHTLERQQVTNLDDCSNRSSRREKRWLYYTKSSPYIFLFTRRIVMTISCG